MGDGVAGEDGLDLDRRKVRSLIYGSCLSRDTVEFMDDVVVVDYIARQSLVSAVGPAWPDQGDLGLTSRFQARSVRGDLSKDALPRLRAAAASTDVVLLDLIDERLGVHLGKDDRMATHSYELTRSTALDAAQKDAVLLGLGSNQHYERWRRAVWHLRQALETQELWERTIVLAPAWAEHDDRGDALPSWRSLTMRQVNERYERYYTYLATVGLTVARVPVAECVAQADHKWSRQPYHYVPGVYHSLASQIRALVSRSTGRP